MVTLKQYNGSTVLPTDDAVLYESLFNDSGIVQGATTTIIGANQLRVATGRIMVCGRMVTVENELVSAELSTSGEKLGRLILRIDMANTEAPAYFATQVGATLPDLVQEDINSDGLIYEFEMARYKAGELAISDLQNTAHRFAGANDYRNAPGTIQMWTGSAIPDGWLLCDGAAVSRTVYNWLFEQIGTSYGQGNGSTTFNVPDMAGRMGVGANSTYALGNTGGEAAHTLLSGELPEITGNIDAYAGDAGFIRYASGCFSPQTNKSAPVNVDAYAQVVSYNTAKLSIGGGQAHNNMPPYTAVNYIIKY